jgi:hypothetical protein
MIRLRSVRESLTLVDCIPEICLINAHDGTSSSRVSTGPSAPTGSSAAWETLRSSASHTVPM